MTTKIYKNDALTLEVRELEGAIEVTWIGKSTAREPGTFLSPILAEVIQQARTAGLGVSLDFRKLEYMNSSTITPLIRTLNEAKRGDARIVVLYEGKLRWQELSFSALTIFQTEDKRIEIRGV